jgi:hypothetical protein
LNRRLFLQAAAALPLASSTAGGLALPAHAESAAFDRSIVRQSARDAASKPFKAPDGNGAERPITAREVNSFIAKATGINISAKDFRTFRASAAALVFLTKRNGHESKHARAKAIVAAARAIQDSGSPFSVIVVVSATPVSAVPNELLTPVIDSGATVHAIVTGNGGADTAARSSETLHALADQTRGQFTTIYSAASYQVALDRLADRLAPQLMVEYVVPIGSSSGNDVQLGVRIPGARVNGLGVR